MQVVDLHPSSCLASRPAWVIYNDFVLGSRNFIRIITDVHREWLVIPVQNCIVFFFSFWCKVQNCIVSA